MIERLRRNVSRSLVSVLVAAAVTVAPATATLLAAPGASRPAEPIGTAAWLADDRNLPDPVRADPDAVHRFLHDAGAATRRELATCYPGVLGNLDGAPVALRYAANRQAMHATGPPYAERPGQFLVFDPRGYGRVAQVFGDLTTADRITVLVPGAGNRADNFWYGVGGEHHRSPAVQAANLYGEAGDDGFAVIAWLGYDTPQALNQATAREDLARAGAGALTRFVAGLAAVRPDATIALFGHSYGSVVVGLAASRLPPQVTDIAVFGSPGMGVDSVAQLGTTAQVWAGESSRDLIRWVPGVRLLGLGHGTRPADSGFGARPFSTYDVSGHDYYLAPGTDSLAELVDIATADSNAGSRP